MNNNDIDNQTGSKTAAKNQGKTESSQGTAGGQIPGSSQGQGRAIDEGRSTRSSSQSTDAGTGQGRSMGAGVGQGQREEGVLSQVQESGRDIANKGLQAISEKTRSATDGYKSEITSGLHTLADGLRQTSSSFRTNGEENTLASAGARYIGDLAEKIESVSGYFERKDATALLQDVRGFAKRNPTVFVGSAFAVGFALSRVIRSGASAATAQRTSNGSFSGKGGSSMPGGTSGRMSSAGDSPMRG